MIKMTPLSPIIMGSKLIRFGRNANDADMPLIKDVMKNQFNGDETKVIPELCFVYEKNNTPFIGEMKLYQDMIQDAIGMAQKAKAMQQGQGPVAMPDEYDIFIMFKNFPQYPPKIPGVDAVLFNPTKLQEQVNRIGLNYTVTQEQHSPSPNAHILKLHFKKR